MICVGESTPVVYITVFPRARRRLGEIAVAEVHLSGSAAGWQAVAKFSIVERHLVISEIVFTPSGSVDIPSAGVTTGLLRSLQVGELLRHVRSALADAPRQIALWENDLGESFAQAKGKAEAAARAVEGRELKRGRRGYGDDHYRRIALAYLQLQEEGWTKGILKELARREKPPRQWQTVRGWVAEARTRRFLSTAVQGRAGAEPGPELYRDPGGTE